MTSAFTAPSTLPPLFPFTRQPRSLEPPIEYAQLRSDPSKHVSRVTLWDGSTPFLLVKHQDICEALVDNRLSKERNRPGFPEMSAGGKAAAQNKPTFVDMDSPAHMNQRRMVEGLFTKEHIDSQRPHIQKVVADQLDEMIKKGCDKPVDLVEAFALAIPSYIIYGILGTPKSDLKYLTSKNATRTNGSATASEASNANKELLDYFGALVEEKMKNPADDLISKLVQEQLLTGHLAKEDVVQIAFLMLVAGNATMVNMINLGVIALLDHPDQLRDLLKDPSLVKPFVEELCRYYVASSFATRRVAKVDVTIGGQLIKAGEGIIAATQSGSRDESVFPNADVFDLHRQRGIEAGLGFGYGPHECVAEWLARAELESVFSVLFQTLPNLRLAVKKEDLELTPSTKDIGVVALPVLW
ncbi:cytochrome P450 55A2 [Mrakia frigida]|uniref:cytochrome P450 n=1 Tax=Mrakia frigida TaxID=29902 RepID=UPI003FCC2443